MAHQNDCNIDFFNALSEHCESTPDYSDREYVRREVAASQCTCYRQVLDKLRTKRNVALHGSVLEFLHYGIITQQTASEVLAICMSYNCCKLHIAAIMHEIPCNVRSTLYNNGIPQ